MAISPIAKIVLTRSSCAGSNQWKISPNPASSAMKVSGLSGQNKILVIDVWGRTVLQISVSTSYSQELDLSSIPQGIYYLRVIEKDGSSKTKKLLKQ